MKKLLGLTCLILLFAGCNENKEARIQKLEKQVEELKQRFDAFESASKSADGLSAIEGDWP